MRLARFGFKPDARPVRLSHGKGNAMLNAPGNWVVAGGVFLALAFVAFGVPALRRRGVFWASLAACAASLAASLLVLGQEFAASINETESWQSTDAVVWQSEAAPPGGEGEPSRFVIGYHYQVGGRAYSGHELALGTYKETDETTQALLEAFPVGREITIFYDPSDPARSVVWPGNANIAMILRVLGAACAGLGAVLLYLFVRRWRLAANQPTI